MAIKTKENQANPARIFLAELIRSERIARNWSEKELADKVQVVPAYIRRVENSQVSISIDLLCRIAKALEIKQINLEF